MTLNENFRGKEASHTNEFWHQKTRVPGLSYGEKNAENFNRLSRAHQRHRQTTDRQTDDRRQTELRSPLANVTFTITTGNICVQTIMYVVSTRLVQC